MILILIFYLNNKQFMKLSDKQILRKSSSYFSFIILANKQLKASINFKLYLQ